MKTMGNQINGIVALPLYSALPVDMQKKIF